MKTVTQKTSIKKLEALCHELEKTQPDQKKIRQLMADADLPYDSDPILQLTSVLNLMNKMKTDKATRTLDI